MGSRNVDPRTALRVVSSIACGSSLGGLVLLAEERRRRILIAQKIIEQGRRLQAHKAYHTAAPIETFDLGGVWDTSLPDLPLRPAGEESVGSQSRALPSSVPLMSGGERLTNREWRARRRVRRRIPTSREAAGGPRRVVDGFGRWEVQKRRSKALDGAEVAAVEAVEVKAEGVVAEGLIRPEVVHEGAGAGAGAGNLELHRAEGAAEHHTRPGDEATLKRSPSPVGIHTTAASLRSTSAVKKASSHMRDRLAKANIPPISVPQTADQLRAAKYLENIVAKRVIQCMQSEKHYWIQEGISELMAYFKDQRYVATRRMHAAVMAANEGLPHDFRHSADVRKRLNELRELCLNTSGTVSSTPSAAEHPEQSPERSFDVDASVLHMNRSLQEGRAQDAYCEFLKLIATNLERLPEMLKATIRNLIEAFQGLGLLSIVNDIRRKCLFILKQAQFALEDVESMISDTPMQNQPRALVDIFKSALAIENTAVGRRRWAEAYNKCVSNLDTWDVSGKVLESLVDVHLQYAQNAPWDLKRKLWISTRYLLKRSIDACMLDKASKLAALLTAHTSSDLICQSLVKEAMVSFLEAQRLEDALKLSMSSLRHSSNLFALERTGPYLATIEKLESSNLKEEREELIWALIRSRYRLGLYDEVCSLNDRLVEAATLPVSVQAMTLHAHNAHDAEALLTRLDEFGIPHSKLPYSALILLLEVNDRRRAATVLQELLHRSEEDGGHRQTSNIFESRPDLLAILDPPAQIQVCESFAKAGSITNAANFISKLPTEIWTLYPDRTMASHKALLSRCWATTRNLDLAWTLLRAMLTHAGDNPDILELYNAGILACVEGQDLAGAQTLANELGQELGLQPDMETRAHLILARGREGDWTTVEEHVENLQKRGLTFSARASCLDRMFVEHCRRHRPDEVYAFAVRFLDKFKLPVTYVVARSVLDVLVRAERQDLVGLWISFLELRKCDAQFSQESFTHMTSRLTSPRFKYDTAAAQLSLRDVEDLAEADKRVDVLNGLAGESVGPNTIGFSATVNATLQHTPPKQHGLSDRRPGSEGLVLSSRDIKRQLERRMLDALAKKRPDRALSMYSSAFGEGVHPNLVTLKLAVEASGRMRTTAPIRGRKARELLAAASATGLNVDAARLALFIQGLRLDQNKVSVSTAIRVLNRQRGDVPDQHLVIALSHNLFRQRLLRGALRILKVAHEQMRKAGGEFGIPAWSQMLRVLIRLQDVEGIRWVVDEVLRLNLRVDVHLINTIRWGRQTPRRTLERSAMMGLAGDAETVKWGAEVSDGEKFQPGGPPTQKLEEQLLAVLDQALEQCRQRREEQRARSVHFAKDATRLMAEHHERMRVTNWSRHWRPDVARDSGAGAGSWRQIPIAAWEITRDLQSAEK